MPLSIQLALIWSGLGLGFGFAMRKQFKGDLQVIPFAVSFVPFIVHLTFISKMLAQSGADDTIRILFLGISLIITIAIFWVGWRSLTRQASTLALLPLLLALIYLLGPLQWLSSISESYQFGLPFIPTLLYLTGTLFVSCLLYSFTITAPTITLPKISLPTISLPKPKLAKRTPKASKRNASQRTRSGTQGKASKRIKLPKLGLKTAKKPQAAANPKKLSDKARVRAGKRARRQLRQSAQQSQRPS